MKKGISFFYGYNVEPEKRAEMIKNSGLDCIMTIADPRFNDQNGTIEEQIELFKKNRLSISSLHMRYRQCNLPEFWKDSDIGAQMEQNLIEDVKIAAKYGFICVVVHLYGEYNKIGIERLERVLKVCEENNIPLAIENIDDQTTFLKTMEYFKNNPYVKMCYDSGHNNFIDPEFDYFETFKDKIICLHLHDNQGDNDDHTLNKYGTINWDDLARKLAYVPNELSLDYELLFTKKCPENAEEVLAEAYKQAVELEEKILKYKTKN